MAVNWKKCGEKTLILMLILHIENRPCLNSRPSIFTRVVISNDTYLATIKEVFGII